MEKGLSSALFLYLFCVNAAAAQPQEVVNLRGLIRLFSDGSVIRIEPTFNFPLHPDDGSVLWKDVQFDPSHNLSLRLYKPASASAAKLPIVFYFHGGGYCFGSRTWPHLHSYSLYLSGQLQAVVAAVDYRLAPENRLPAALEDGIASLEWLQGQAASGGEEWLKEADFGRVFVVGDSSGGNIAHHFAIRDLGGGAGEAPTVRLRGFILLGPFFGGVQRTPSEAAAPTNASFNLDDNDKFWLLSLPRGEDRDSSISNPFGPNSPDLQSTCFQPMLVVAAEEDLLRDRVKQYATKLREWGKSVEYQEFPGKEHGFHYTDPFSDAAKQLMELIKGFVAKIK